MSDLANMTVEELREYEERHKDRTSCYALIAFDELARRFTKAQAEIKTLRNIGVTQQEQIERMRPVVEAATAMRATLIGWVHDVGEAVRAYEAGEKK